jgi:hypothetical protein
MVSELKRLACRGENSLAKVGIPLSGVKTGLWWTAISSPESEITLGEPIDFDSIGTLYPLWIPDRFFWALLTVIESGAKRVPVRISRMNLN